MKDVPLELFGGLCSEMQPGDLPQGASPLCQDMDFELGATFTRYGLYTALFCRPSFREHQLHQEPSLSPMANSKPSFSTPQEIFTMKM